MSKSALITAHRWLGVIACIGIFLWGISGLCHPIMTHLQPAPVQFISPQQDIDLSSALSPQNILQTHGIASVKKISVITLQQHNYYQISSSKNTRYFDVVNGQELKDGDQQYAAMLASHFTGQPISEITSYQRINHFDDDYHPVNQLLPVWRVEFKGDQHLRAYIDTEESRLSTLVDDTRHTLTKIFQFGHNWSFSAENPLMQVTMMAVILAIALLSAGSGIVMFIKLAQTSTQRLMKKPLRKSHRMIGLAVSVTTLLFASSGMFHLIISYQHEQSSKQAAPTTLISAKVLSDDAWQNIIKQHISSLHLIQVDNKSYWLLSYSSKPETQHTQVAALAQESHHQHHTQDTQPAFTIHATQINQHDQPEPSLISLAKVQAIAYSGLLGEKIKAISWVTQFAGEYGFIFKRLPVLKVEFSSKDNPRYYIEPSTGTLAATIKDIDAWEGFSFAYLHKWSYSFLNKDFRDIMVMIFALMNITVAILGLVLFTRHYKSRL